MRRTLLAPLAGSLLAAPLWAQTAWYVDDVACPAPGTGTQADPFCTIQAGIDAAADGDTVLVLPGNYAGVDFQGKDVVVRSVAGPGTTKIVGASFATIRFDSGEGPGAVLQGFDIRDGSPVILCTGSSPTIAGNVVRNGFNAAGGGGLRITGGGSPLVRGNEFRSNVAPPGVGVGGGFYVAAASPRFENNVVHHNNAFEDQGGSYGGGGYVLNATVTFVGNLFYANTSSDNLFNVGGGLYASGSTLTFVGNTFVGNTAHNATMPGTGGAIALDLCVATFQGHVSWNNVATRGPELAQKDPGTIDVSYSLLKGGLAAVYEPTGVTWGAGNLDTDPLFVDPAAANYHVLPSSPVVDAGAPTTPTGGTDADLDPRILDGNGDGTQLADMGWDEVNPSSLVAVGLPTIGGSLTLQTSGPAGQVYALAYALGTFDFTFAPYGSLLIDPTTLTLVAFGPVPGSDVVAVPPDPGLLGTQVYFQALVRNMGPPGSFTRRLELTLR